MVLVPWALAFISNYFLFIHNHPATAAQRTNYAFAFFPTDVLSCEFITFLNETIHGTFFVMLNISQQYFFPWVLLALFIIALRHIYKHRQYRVFLYVCLPVLFHAVLSALKIYPFWYRLILYLTPCFIYLISVGLVQLVAFIKNKSHVSLAIIPALGIYYFLTSDAVKQFPLWFREIKPALAYVNGMPSEMHLYMSEPAHAYEYYYKRGEARIPVYREIPWSLNDGELEELVDEEKSPYMIFYIPGKLTNVIDGLKKKGSLIHSFMYKNYGVAVIKPIVRDYNTIKLNYTYFEKEKTFHEDNSVAIWNGEIQSKEFRLTAGKYIVTTISRGTPVGGIYPINSLFINGQKLGVFTSGSSFKKDTFNLIINKDLSSRVRITLDNDEQTNEEDRNTFLRAIVISPEKKTEPSLR